MGYNGLDEGVLVLGLEGVEEGKAEDTFAVGLGMREVRTVVLGQEIGAAMKGDIVKNGEKTLAPKLVHEGVAAVAIGKEEVKDMCVVLTVGI